MSQGTRKPRTERATRTSIDVPLAVAVMALPLVLVAAQVPAQLVLPGIATFAFVLAATTAAFGWFMQAERGGSSITIFDVSGACVLIGIAAGAFSEPNQVFQFFGAAMTAS